MIGQRQRQKILKNLVRRGVLTGQLLRGSEIRGLRRKYSVSVDDFARWCSVSADVILKTEGNPDCYVDGVLASQLVLLARQFDGQNHQFNNQTWVEPPPKPMTEPPEPPTEPVQQAPAVEPFTKTEQATLNRIARLDLTDLRTAGQRALAAIDIWVAEHKLKKLVVNPKAATSRMRKEARDAIAAILDITDRELLEAWLLYRQTEAGEKCLVAIQRVRRGELRASSASADYDAYGWRGRGDSRKKNQVKKVKRQKGSTGSAPALPARETSDAAEQIQAALGSLHLKLMKFEQDYAGDREVVDLVTAARVALDPSYQEVKRMVLRRARRKNRRTTRKDPGRTTPEREKETP